MQIALIGIVYVTVSARHLFWCRLTHVKCNTSLNSASVVEYLYELSVWYCTVKEYLKFRQSLGNI